MTSIASDIIAIEQTPLSLKGKLSVTGSPGAPETVRVTISVSHGTISISPGTSGVSSVTGNHTGAVTILGSLAQINSLLNSNPASTITYLATSDTPPAAATLTVSVLEDSADGRGSGLTTTTSGMFAINAVNDAPVLAGFVPSLTFDENVVNAAP